MSVKLYQDLIELNLKNLFNGIDRLKSVDQEAGMAPTAIGKIENKVMEQVPRSVFNAPR